MSQIVEYFIDEEGLIVLVGFDPRIGS